jgi:hypothetical protein
MEPEGSSPYHKSSPPVPVLSQTNPIHISKPHFPKIHLNVILPSMPRSSQWSPTFSLKLNDVWSNRTTLNAHTKLEHWYSYHMKCRKYTVSLGCLALKSWCTTFLKCVVDTFFIAQYWEMFIPWKNTWKLKIIISMYFINGNSLSINTFDSYF